MHESSSVEFSTGVGLPVHQIHYKHEKEAVLNHYNTLEFMSIILGERQRFGAGERENFR